MDDLISSLQSFAISNDEKIFEESLNDMVIKPWHKSHVKKIKTLTKNNK